MNAQWIWEDAQQHPQNRWVCFRKTFLCTPDTMLWQAHITADSRYLLYINGVYLGTGPARYWPFEMRYDTYDISHLLVPGDNVIGVLVQHIGQGTSQYVEGVAGLLCELVRDGATVLCSDTTWRCAAHIGYLDQRTRINFSFPWVEQFDAARFAENWADSCFDDSAWQHAVAAQAEPEKAPKQLLPRDVPLMTDRLIQAKRLVSKSSVRQCGVHCVVNFAAAFYPNDFAPCDRKQLGLLATQVHAAKDCQGILSLADRKIPLVRETFRLNGQEYVFEPEVDALEVSLQKGANFLVFNVSGCYQRYQCELYFQFPCALTFSIPYCGHQAPFLAVGPFDSAPVHNIMQSDGVMIDEAQPDYVRMWNCTDVGAFTAPTPWITPLDDKDVDTENIQLLCKYRQCEKVWPLQPADSGMLLGAPYYTQTSSLGASGMEYIIDFGALQSGYVEFEVEATEGARLDFYFYEHHGFEGMELCSGLNNSMRYFTANGRHRYRSPLKRGLRFVSLTVYSAAPLKIHSLAVHQSGYPVTDSGRFRCSDFLLNRIWEISRHTTRLCMEDTYVDCPTYEQAYWVGDARDTALINFYLFGAYPLSRHSLLFAGQSLKRSALPEAAVPLGRPVILTTWSMLWVMACREYYWFSGDFAFVRDIFPLLQQTAAEFLRHQDVRGLFSMDAWNMIDWAEMDTPSDGIITHQNVMFARLMEDMVFFCALLDTDAALYHTARHRVIKALNQYLWSDTAQAFADCLHADGTLSSCISMQSNIVALLYDCVHDERKETLTKYLEKAPERFVKIGSPFMSFFYHEALAKEHKISALLEDIRIGWGDMLAEDATTCWETFRGYTQGRLTRSHCHAWSAGPAYFLAAYILGVRPISPGFQQVLIAPSPAGLSYAEGTVPTPRGNIDIAIRVVQDTLVIKLRIPASIEYTLRLPPQFSASENTEVEQY